MCPCRFDCDRADTQAPLPIPTPILIVPSGSPGVLPMSSLRGGYQGSRYEAEGVANNDFLRVAKKAWQA